jgi:hypothetical protein
MTVAGVRKAVDFAGQVSRGCETTGRPVISSACSGFECVNNLGYGDRCLNQYHRGCPQKRLHSLQIFQDALLLEHACRRGLPTESRCAGG